MGWVDCKIIVFEVTNNKVFLALPNIKFGQQILTPLGVRFLHYT